MARACTLELLIESFVSRQRPAATQSGIVEAISQEVIHGRVTIQSLVLTLGIYLTTTNNIMRARGTLLLSDVLVELSGTPLENTSVKSLINFFSARLADWHCLRGAVLGSLSLLRRPNIESAVVEEGTELAKSALANLHVQVLAQHDRVLCLELFECLLEKHANATKSLEVDLLCGVGAAVEEEKDPRCLLLAFRIIQLLVRLYPDPSGPITSCANELFDVVSRYFPISFNPQSGAPNGITRENLATALKETFVCTPVFAPFCIPLLLEMLTCSLPRAKVDALNYLGHCGLVYGAKALRDYAVPVWNALKAELLPFSMPPSSVSSELLDVEIVKEAVSCLRSWVLSFQTEKDLSLAVTNDSVIFRTGDFLKLILQDGLVEELFLSLESDARSLGHAELAISDSAMHQSEAVGRVLVESARASPSSCFVICRLVLTRLLSVTLLMSGTECSTSQVFLEHVQKEEVMFSPKITSFHASSAAPAVVIPSVGEIRENQDWCRFRSVIGLDIVLQIVIAARSLVEICLEEHGHPVMTFTNWLDPLRELSKILIAAFHQTLSDEWSEDSAVLGEMSGIPRIYQKVRTGTDIDFKTALGALNLCSGRIATLASFPPSLSLLSSDQLRKILSILKDLVIYSTDQKLLTYVFTALEVISSVEEQAGRINGEVGVLTVVTPGLLRAVREAKTGTGVGNPLRVLAKICGRISVARQLVINHLTESIHLDLSKADANEEVDEICAKLVAVLQCLSEDFLPWCDGESADQSASCGLSMEIWIIGSAQAVNRNQEVLRWSLKVMREAVLKCNAAVQSKIIQNRAEFSFDRVSHHHEEEMDWSIGLGAAVIVSLRPGTVVPNMQGLLSRLMQTAQSGKLLLITETAAQAVASVLNKWVTASIDETGAFTLEKAVHMVLAEGCLSKITFNPILGSAEETDIEKDGPCGFLRLTISDVRTAAWIGKGLAMRGHRGVFDVTSVLRLLLSGPAKKGKEFILAMTAAEGLGIILQDSNVCLNKLHHAVVRPLYKQRFFNKILSRLLEDVRASIDNRAKLWLYRGIGHVMRGTPHVALLADGARVFPVILRTLSFLHSDQIDWNLLLSALLALSVFLADTNEGRLVAGEHVYGIVKRMLILIQYQYSVVVRERALQCLGAVVRLPYARVYPLRTEVLKALLSALDDKKRVGRKGALLCRRVWFELYRPLIASKSSHLLVEWSAANSASSDFSPDCVR